MPPLLELQRAFAACILADKDVAPPPEIDGGALSAAARLRIYRNSFASALVKALRLAYPAVERLVGADFFEGAARAFIAAHPPQGAWLDEYGAALPDFLAGFAPAARVPYLSDVARLEWAAGRAAAAPDAPALDLAALAALPEAKRATLRLTPHPSLSLVACRYPAEAIWRATLAGDDDALSEIVLACEPHALLVHRSAAGMALRRLDAAEARFTEGLIGGRPLGAALAEAAGIDAVALLAEHLAEGRFAGFSSAAAGAPA
jgi:hypothetical protein